MRDSQKKNRKKILGLGVIVLFIILTGIIISSWKDSDTRKQKIKNIYQSQIKDQNTSNKLLDSSAKTTPEALKKDESKQVVDPALKDVTINEIPVEDPGEMSDDPKIRETQRMIRLMTTPMEVYNDKLPSFIYEGEMKVIVPTLNMDEKSNREGKRYGDGIEINGKFKYIKDESGNFHVHQETKTKKGDTKYDKQEFYNGDLYFIDGKYTYANPAGKISDGDKTIEVLSTLNKNDKEPLVRRNWIQIIKDLDLVIGFDPTAQSDAKQSYAIKGINPEMQKKTVNLDKLLGSVTVSDQIMTDATIEGKGQLKRGYMSGAEVTYSIKMSVHDIGNVQRITPP